MDWMTHRRETGLVEHVCEHRVGHPNRGSAVWLAEHYAKKGETGGRESEEGWLIHGCCEGICCGRDDFPGTVERALQHSHKLIRGWKDRFETELKAASGMRTRNALLLAQLREEKMKITHVVGAAIIRDSKCFIARRNEGTLAGMWEFPGGKVEPDEDPCDALQRELREELEIEVMVGRFLGQGLAPIGDRWVCLDVYCATVDADSFFPKRTVHDDFCWIGLLEVQLMHWAPADVPVLAALESELAPAPALMTRGLS